jgi:hypothetical protein
VDGKAKRVSVKTSRRVKIIEIQLDAGQPQFGFIHACFPL